MNAYHVGDISYEWSMLVFAENRQQAKVLGWHNWPFPQSECEYTGVRVWKADPKYMVFAKSDKPHVVDDYEGDFETWREALEHKLKQLEDV